MAKCFPLRTFFYPGKQRKVIPGKIDWIGRVEYGSHAVFGQKLLNTQRGVGRWARKSSIMKSWANSLKESSKKAAEAERSLSQQHQLYTDTYWFLSLYYKGLAVQKIIPFFGRYPLVYNEDFLIILIVFLYGKCSHVCINTDNYNLLSAYYGLVILYAYTVCLHSNFGNLGKKYGFVWNSLTVGVSYIFL